ncbi:hypothetical protein MCOR25_005858 [Pyricularia grisea]|nr:hypothetical protein MCOR25_005858 [Pyricularia grisea]
MTPPTRALLAGVRRLAVRPQLRLIHNSTLNPASVHPVSGNGPPPEPPRPVASDRSTGLDARITKRRRQAEMLKRAQELRSGEKNNSGSGAAARASGLKRRFWRDCHVREVDGAYEVHLDTRGLRHPTTKEIVRIPLSKPQLAYALALEWDQLESAQQATKQHLIPLTSLVCRAIDLAADDAAGGSIRTSIIDTVLRYLDTDTLLCWAPAGGDEAADGRTLRQAQEDAARPIITHLQTKVWPGIKIEPALDDGGLLPKPQAPGVRDVIRGWLLGLSSWDLAGVERATLAGKGLLAATRLVCEWSPALQVADGAEVAVPAFGVEEAAQAVSVEVNWQTKVWGEVEDTHDVEKEDVRRQFGSVVLLVSG